jgi:hypothetical protein
LAAGSLDNGKPGALNGLIVKDFNLYDILGVLAPGVVVTIGLMTIFPETSPVLAKENFSAGELGFVILISYVIGNLVAGLGNFLESGYWRFRGGWPTDRAHQSDGKILEAREIEALQEKLRNQRVIGQVETLKDLAGKDWWAITKRVYVGLAAKGASRRIDIFNAQYGMNRGIAAGFVVLIVMLLFQSGIDGWRIQMVLAGCTILSFYRMERFARHYTAELLRSYLADGTIGNAGNTPNPTTTE